MNKRTEDKLKDLSGMKKAMSELLGQAWERGYKYGYETAKDKFERPKEKWIYKKPKNYVCSCCGYSYDNDVAPYCWYCGADMREANNE